MSMSIDPFRLQNVAAYPISLPHLVEKVYANSQTATPNRHTEAEMSDKFCISFDTNRALASAFHSGPILAVARNQQEGEMMRYKYLKAVQENGPDYFLIYEGVKVFGAAPIARCDKEEEAKRIVGALNGEGHKGEEQNEVDYIGCRIAQRLTGALSLILPVPYSLIEKFVYDEISQIGKEHRIGDWIELPNGTTYTLTFKPARVS